MNTAEEWRVIPGFDGWYEASNLGRIRSWKCTGVVGVRRTRPRILLGKRTDLGYVLVKLTHPVFGAMNVGAHQLVLAAFVGPRPLRGVCDHINAQPSDNRVENVRWVTAAQNIQHAAELGRIRGRTGPRGFSSLTAEKVRTMRLRHAEGAPLKELSAQFGVSVATASRVVNGLVWKEVA